MISCKLQIDLKVLKDFFYQTKSIIGLDVDMPFTEHIEEYIDVDVEEDKNDNDNEDSEKKGNDNGDKVLSLTFH